MKNISCLEPHYKEEINAFFVGALLQLLNNPESVWVGGEIGLAHQYDA